MGTHPIFESDFDCLTEKQKMNFAAIMKDEVNRKRKKLQTELKVDSKDDTKKKYFKRSELERVQREKYEERMGMKKVAPSNDRIAEWEAKTQAMLDRMGPDQAKMMPREIVLKKLRERNEPIILFGETEAESFFRLRKLELGCQEQYKIKGWTNEIKDAMETLDGEDNAVLTGEMSRGNDKAAKQYNIVYKYANPEVDLLWLETNAKCLVDKDHDNRADVIIKSFQFWQKCWADELNERPVEEKATIKGRSDAAVWKQTENYIKPLYERIRKNLCPDDIMKHLSMIVNLCIKGNYIKASDIYLKMAIGNAPWPIGVDQVGIHMRPSRETISMRYVAHVLNDETQRKFIQGLKRLMTVAQRHFPSAPSRCVEYGAGMSLLDPEGAIDASQEEVE